MNIIDIFPWNDNFNTGLTVVDQQHRKLVELLNRLASQVAYGATAHVLGEIFDELAEYAVYHFETEETIWHGYFASDRVEINHISTHASFTQEVSRLKIALQESASAYQIAEETLGFLARWLAVHILESDRYMAYAALAVQQGLSLEEAKARAREQMSGATRVLIDIILSIYSTLSSNAFQLMRELDERRKMTYELQEKTEALAAFNRDFEGFLYQTSDFIYFKDINSRIRFCSQTLAEITGHRDWHEMIGKHDREVFPPETARIYEEEEIPVFAEGKPVLNKIDPYFDAEGRPGYVATNKWPQLNATGQVTGIFGISRDITEHMQAEAELERHRHHLAALVEERTAGLKTSEARTRAILSAMLDSVVHIDAKGIILSVNHAAQKLFGYTENEMLGSNISMLMPEPYASNHDGYLARYQQTREAHIVGNRREVEARHRDGRIFPIEMAVNELTDEAGSTFIGVVRDLSAQKAAENELKDALKAAKAAAEAKSHFLANMSHEIRTPLNGVLGLAEIGLRDYQGDESAASFKRILESGNHLLSVVNDVLDFSKIEAGRMTVETRPFSPLSIIDNVKSFVVGRAVEKDLPLSIEIAPDLPHWVAGDALRLAQILTNLLSNAIKFTERGEVALHVMRAGDEIQFKVTDSGIGMTQMQLSRLFQPFEQADGSITRQFGGTGLGLAISRELARMMHGDISVDSELGVGSTFCLHLPLPKTDAPARLPPHSAATGPRLAGIRVLAADDVDINRFILEDLLKYEGAQIALAENGKQTLELIEENGADAFDVVLMDVQMPVMDGLEATGHIRSVAPDLPVIGLTAHALADERSRCFSAGMVDHVTKPVDINLLVDAIRRSLRPSVKTSARPSDCNDPQIIDLSILSARVGSEPARLTKYSNRFLEMAGTTLTEMQTTLETRDLQSLARLGHRLKSAALTVGAMRFGGICHELENLAGNNHDAAYALVENLQSLLTQIESCLKNRGKNP